MHQTLCNASDMGYRMHETNEVTSMTGLVEIIAAELGRQAEETGAYISMLPDHEIRYDGLIAIDTLALAIETALAERGQPCR